MIGDERIEVPSVVNLIYEMDGNPYFATFKGELSEDEVYYQIKNDSSSKEQTKKIFLYK